MLLVGEEEPNPKGPGPSCRVEVDRSVHRCLSPRLGWGVSGPCPRGVEAGSRSLIARRCRGDRMGSTTMQVWAWFGHRSVNLFASKENNLCPLWYSIRPEDDPLLGVDSLA